MRAAVCATLNDDMDLELREVPVPSLVPGSVLIDVHAAGVNFADCLMVSGTYQERPGVPFTPGMEIAGVVREVGPGVSSLRRGQRVMAIVDHGAFAECAIARSSDVFPMPDAMDFTTAAAFPIAYGTSMCALRTRAALKGGDVVLVLGAAGGVGLTAVQLAKALGARVIAAAGSDARAAFALENGADLALSYAAGDIVQNVRSYCRDLGRTGVDIVYDPVGGAIGEQAVRVLGAGGRWLLIGFASGALPKIPANHLLVKNISALGFYWGGFRQSQRDQVASDFEQMFAWWLEGRLPVQVSETRPLEYAGEALNLLRLRKSTGKVVVSIRQG